MVVIRLQKGFLRKLTVVNMEYQTCDRWLSFSLISLLNLSLILGISRIVKFVAGRDLLLRGVDFVGVLSSSVRSVSFPERLTITKTSCHTPLLRRVLFFLKFRALAFFLLFRSSPVLRSLLLNRRRHLSGLRHHRCGKCIVAEFLISSMIC